MERLSVLGGVALVILVSLACKDGKTDAVVDSGVTTTTAAASTSATPAADVTRYDDEETLDKATPITLKKPTTVRRTADAAGPELASLNAGDKVTVTAVHQEFALVTLDSGKMGWIGGDVVREALGGAKPATKPAAAIACKPGELKDGTTCRKKCNADRDCPKNGVCVPAVAGGDLVCVIPDPEPGAAKPAACKAGETMAGDMGCIKECTDDSGCGKGGTCAPTQFQDPSAGLVHTHMCIYTTPTAPSASGATTAASSAPCPNSLEARCKGVCVNIQTDDKNCGGCGTVCRPGTHCNLAMHCMDSSGNY